jgi:uncharacterized membrane protein YdjX (TVP38/TMEM64 family)
VHRPTVEEEVADSEATAPRRLLLATAVLGLLVALVRLLHAERLLEPLTAAAREQGAAGLGLLLLAYLPVTLAGLPTAPLSLAAGLALGPFLGAAVAIPANTVAACLAFLLGRALVRRDAAALARGQGRVARAARALGQGGFRLVLLLRLSWVAPFGLLNYAFGASPCRLRDFALATLVGTSPIILAYAWAGALLLPALR